MMNLFLKYLLNGDREDWINIEVESRFKYSNNIGRETVGIWIFSEPIIKKNLKGDEIAVFLMDTQGWHDDRTTEKENQLIFGLNCVLSSVMIYNVHRNIGEDDFSYIKNYTSKALDLSEMGDEPFQKLIILIRDWWSNGERGFSYGYYDSRYPRGSKDFIQNKLQLEGKSTEAQMIRKILTRQYEQICAYLMPYPGSVVNSWEFNSSTIDCEFKKHINDFCSILFAQRNLVLAKFNNKYLRGIELLDLMKTKFVNNLSLLNLPELFERMSVFKKKNLNELEQLDSGNFGQVFKVKHQLDKQLYAVKKITALSMSFQYLHFDSNSN